MSLVAATITEAFVDKIRTIAYDALPPEAIEVSKQIVLDALAVTLAGADEPTGVGRVSIAYVAQIGGAPQASVIAGGFKTSMQEAAYANGTMAHALDWDDGFFTLSHPTSPTLSANLAIAEHYRLPGAKVIEAIVVALEVQAQVGVAATGLGIGTGFHKNGTVGTFGAVGAAAKLLELNREQTLMAFGLAGSRAGSLAINTGSMTKASHSGHAARSGVECAVLAQMGWTANRDVFGPKGFFDTFMPGDAKPEMLIEGLGAGPLRMIEPGMAFKKYPSNYLTHRAIDAALSLRQEYGIQRDQIEHVDVTFAPLDYVNRPQPDNGLDGKHSAQYTTAIALLDGEVTVESFTDERRYASDVVALLPKIRFHSDAAISKLLYEMHTIVTVSLKDGRQVAQRVDRLSGWMGSPLTREERLQKFFSCTGRLLDHQRAKRLLELVERLDTLPDVTELMDIARCDVAK